MSEALHPEKGPFLGKMQAGEHFVGYYVLRTKQLEPFRDASRGYYLTLLLSDRSGQMVGRVWEGAEQAFGELHTGKIVKVDGETESYQDRVQIRVKQVREADSGEYALGDMLPSSLRDPDEMMAELQGFIDRVDNEFLRRVLDTFFTDAEFLQRFMQAPAAKRVHHAYLGGLLEHTLEVLYLAERVTEVYPQVDADLLFSGVLLHDIGKIREYSWGLDIDYSDEGRLIGHIVLTEEMITGAIANLSDVPEELALRLRHMLLAHHGRHEWGSPRRPMTLEAVALHHVENLSAQINRFDSLMERRPAGESWTRYDRMLGRQLYAGEGDELNIEERSRSE